MDGTRLQQHQIYLQCSLHHQQYSHLISLNVNKALVIKILLQTKIELSKNANTALYFTQLMLNG